MLEHLSTGQIYGFVFFRIKQLIMFEMSEDFVAVL